MQLNTKYRGKCKNEIHKLMKLDADLETFFKENERLNNVNYFFDSFRANRFISLRHKTSVELKYI